MKKCIEKQLKFTCQKTYSIPQVALYFQSFSLIGTLTRVCSTLNNVLTNQNSIFLTVIQSPAFISHLQTISSRLAKSAFWTTCVVEREQDLFFLFLSWERKCSGSMSKSYAQNRIKQKRRHHPEIYASRDRINQFLNTMNFPATELKGNTLQIIMKKCSSSWKNLSFSQSRSLRIQFLISF